MISGKFAVTLHILTLLSKFPEAFLTSEFIAGSLNINAVLVRKEIANLKKNQLVESKEGKNGGTRLLKPAQDITLDAIYKITFDRINLGFSKNIPNPKCPIGKQINTHLSGLYVGINEKISQELQAMTLLDFSNKF